MKILLTTALLSSLINLAPANTQDEVEKTLNIHFNGIKEGKLDLIEKAWKKEVAQITEVKSGVVKKQNVDRTFKMWSEKKHPNFRAEIKSITEISDFISIAKVAITWNGQQYSDALTLTRHSEGWKIISKVYQAPKVEKGGGYGSKL